MPANITYLTVCRCRIHEDSYRIPDVQSVCSDFLYLRKVSTCKLFSRLVNSTFCPLHRRENYHTFERRWVPSPDNKKVPSHWHFVTTKSVLWRLSVLSHYGTLVIICTLVEWCSEVTFSNKGTSDIWRKQLYNRKPSTAALSGINCCYCFTSGVNIKYTVFVLYLP